MDPRLGGPPVSALELAAAQVRLGADVSLLYRSTEQGKEGVASLRASVRDGDKVNFIGVPMDPTIRSRFSGSGVRSAIKNLKELPDILHAHGVWDPALGQASRALPQSVRRIVATKGMLHPYCMSSKTLRKRLAMATLSRDLLSKAHRILALNDEESEAIEQRFGVGRGGVLPNGIDLASLPTGDEAAFRATCPSLGDRPYFVFIGRLNVIKGVDVLLEAFFKCRADGHDIDLVLIGPDSGMVENIRSRIQEAGAKNVVHITGPVYGEQKYDALKGARAFAMPSRYEGWGNAVVESMAMATPVVISPQCHLPDIEKTKTGLVAERTPEAFGAALSVLAGDPEYAATLGRNAADRARKEFDWSARAMLAFEFYSD
jgi:glycosyltransferase involved in cell wall biosynthesis